MKNFFAEKNTDRLYVLYIIGVFFLAQFLYYLANSGFHSAYGGVDPFVIDVSTMKDHFWQTIFYYHQAPPLHIFYVAAFYLLFPPIGELGFYFLHTLLGIYAAYSLFKTQRRLNVSAPIAAFLTITFILSPGFNLMQTVSAYDYPTGCILLIATWRLVSLLDKQTNLNALHFFVWIMLLCSVRSLYHVLFYFLPLILITLWIFRKQWRMILLSSLIPFLIVLAPYVKNYFYFHIFSTSSYLGETLDSIVMQFTVNTQQREEGVKKGFFTNLALCPSSAGTTRGPTRYSKYGGWECYSNIAEPYREAYIKELGTNYPDVPYLSCTKHPLPMKGIQFPRGSCLGNIGLSRAYGSNAYQAMVHYPDAYKEGIKNAIAGYFKTESSYFFDITGNSRHLPMTLNKRWFVPYPPALLFFLPMLFFFGLSYLVYSRFGIMSSLFIYYIIMLPMILKHADHRYMQHLQNFFYLAIILLSIRLLLNYALQASKSAHTINTIRFFTEPAADKTQRFTILFTLCNILFTSILINTTVGYAQQRYRFYIDGLYFVLLGVFLQYLVSLVRQRYEKKSTFT